MLNYLIFLFGVLFYFFLERLPASQRVAIWQFTSLSALHGPDWVGPKLEQGTQPRSPTWIAGMQLLEPSLLPPWVCISKSWSQQPEPQIEPSHSHGMKVSQQTTSPPGKLLALLRGCTWSAVNGGGSDHVGSAGWWRPPGPFCLAACSGVAPLTLQQETGGRAGSSL